MVFSSILLFCFVKAAARPARGVPEGAAANGLYADAVWTLALVAAPEVTRDEVEATVMIDLSANYAVTNLSADYAVASDPLPKTSQASVTLETVRGSGAVSATAAAPGCGAGFFSPGEMFCDVSSPPGGPSRPLIVSGGGRFF
jgi:hypothetical protein